MIRYQLNDLVQLPESTILIETYNSSGGLVNLSSQDAFSTAGKYRSEIAGPLISGLAGTSPHVSHFYGYSFFRFSLTRPKSRYVC